MKLLAIFMVWSLRFEYAISQPFMGPEYRNALAQDLAHWEGIAAREGLQS